MLDARPLVPATSTSVPIARGWAPLLLGPGRPVPPAANVARHRPPRDRVRQPIRGRVGADPLPDHVRAALDRVGDAVDDPTRSPRNKAGTRRDIAAAALGASAALCRHLGFARPDGPGAGTRLALTSHRPADGDRDGWSCAAAIAALEYLAQRATGPRDAAWYKAALSGKWSSTGLAPRSLRTYYYNLCSCLVRMAGTPLPRWDERTLGACGEGDIARKTHEGRALILEQLRHFVAALRTGARLSAWRLPQPPEAAPPDAAPPDAPLLAPGDIDAIFAALARHRRGEELVLLAALQLGYGMRVTEASTRLWSDLERTLAVVRVTAPDTKGRRTATLPRCYMPPAAESLLRRRRQEAEAESRSRGAHAPLLPSAGNVRDLARLHDVYRYELDKVGVRPHDLRHLYVTLTVMLAVALQTGVPASALPAWAEWLRHGSDAVDLAGRAANHAHAATTGASYVHCATWAQARFFTAGVDTQAMVEIPITDAARILGRHRDTLTRQLRQAGHPPTRRGRTNYTTVGGLLALLA